MKKLYKFAVSVLKGTFIFWFIYTVIFQLAEGWHWKATSDLEKILDIGAGAGFDIGVFLWAVCLAHHFDKFMKEEK